MFSREKSTKAFKHYTMLGTLLVLLAACGIGGGHAIHTDTRQVRVAESDFRIASSLKTFSTGVTYHFVIRNHGRTMHEFMITPLTLSTMNGMSMSDIDQMSLAKVENIAPGHVKILDYTFPASTTGSRLQFACHYPGHYEAGMSLNVAVRP